LLRRSLPQRRHGTRKRGETILGRRGRALTIAKLLDNVTVLPSVRRAYAREGITDDIC
jgi:hypothetical protein